MSSLDDRKSGEETKYALDQQTMFKATARRNKLTGLWAAELLGLSGDDADAYAKSVVIADLEEAGDEDVIRKILGDFEEKSVAKNRDDVVAQLAVQMSIAVEQIKTEG